MKPVIRLVFLLIFACTSVSAAPALNAEQQKCVGKAKRFERAGWIYLHVEGEPRERGFQHGYLLAKEIKEAMRVTKREWEYQSAMDWTWLVTNAAAMFVPKIDGEDMAELEGITGGARAGGVEVSRDEMIAYNGIIELSDYWWPQEKKKMKDADPTPNRQSCSSFIATGSYTKDGNIVLGHNTMQSYQEVWPNVIEDIVPAHGHHIFWQTSPGWIHSGTDFFITDAGIVGSETTIGNFEGFDTNGVPEFTRMRRATQDSASLDEWAAIMKKGNNGGYANAWLVGDINTREIARLELGLKYTAYEKKRDGYFTGSNVAEDRKILLLETERNDTDIRSSSVARRLRWRQLMKDYNGKIDVALAKKFEGDHFDMYRNKLMPSGRTLCGHFDLDGEAGGQGQGVPFDGSGTVDAKVVDAVMAKQMSFAARWGSGCGIAFSASKYLAAHPQFEWVTDLLRDRPSEPWVVFRAGE
jgi:hypothetical protein